VPPHIYLGGITLSPDATAEHVRNAPWAVYDSWNAVELAPFGFRRERVETWYVRPPKPLHDERRPAELEIVRVASDDLAEFEAVSVRGFGDEGETLPVGSIHPPNPDPRMTYWLGRARGEAVCVGMSYETEAAIGIFGVTTITRARNRGYATALMRHAVLADRVKPAVLNTDTQAARRVYERLGFERVGECQLWSPGPVSRTEPEPVLT
jgi:ribosomal protein S18 acetylase RimI-like enzyme